MERRVAYFTLRGTVSASVCALQPVENEQNLLCISAQVIMCFAFVSVKGGRHVRLVTAGKSWAAGLKKETPI